MGKSPISLTFREKIPRTNSNTILTVPNLTHRNLILSKIDFETEQWHFEAVLKCASNDLVKMSTSYFQHQHNLDLSGHRARLEEGDKLELYIKPKQSPKDIELMICYTYEASNGSVYYQNSDRVMDLNESTVLTDITQGMTPTCLYLKSDEDLGLVSLTPKFIGTDETPSYQLEVSGNSTELNFNSSEFAEILPILRFYELKVARTGNVDAQIHFMARGFKNK